MKKASDLASKALHSGTQTCTAISTAKSSLMLLPEHWTAALFKKFAMIYGPLWTSRLGTQQQTDDMLRVWAEGLHGLTGDEIKQGLACLPDMPPSLPQFRHLCRRYLTAAHRPFPKALPKPPPDYEAGREQIKKLKEALKKSPPGGQQG